MTKKKISVYFLSALFLLLQVYIFFFREFQTFDFAPYINESPVPIDDPSKQITQEFRTPGPLSRIDILLGTYKIVPKNGVIRLQIFKKNQTIYTKNYPAFSIQDNLFHHFDIDYKNTRNIQKINKGNYKFRISFFSKDKNEKMAAWTSNTKFYPYGDFLIDNKKQSGDITFRIYYLSTISQQIKRWLQYKPQLPIRPYLLAAGFLLLLFVVNFLFYYFIKRLIMNESLY